MARSGAVRDAEALEADAVLYPEERGEILLEAAHAWRLAGHREHARRIVDQLVADGGDDGCWARSTRLEYLLEDDGDWPTAWVEAEALARDPDLDASHCEMVAEILVGMGATEQGLAWYDRGVARLDEAHWAGLRDADAWYSWAGHLVHGRLRVRRQLGLPEDVTDALAPSRPACAPEPPPVHVEAPATATEPGRNQPCSCGSGVKYKKCCGRPG